MKKLIVAVAAAALFSAAFADEAFDKLDALAKMPKAQLVAANATEVFDAAIATTNNTTIKSLVELKLVSFADMFAKTKGKLQFANVQCAMACKYATLDEKVEAFKDFADVYIAAPAEKHKDVIRMFINYVCYGHKNGEFLTKLAPDAVAEVCEKLDKSGAQHKDNAIIAIIYAYGKANWGNVPELADKYKDKALELVRSKEVYMIKSNGYDFIMYLFMKKEFALARELLADVELSRPWAYAPTPAIIGWRIAKFEPTLSDVRRKFITDIAATDTGIICAAKIQDMVDKNKETTVTLAWPRLKDPANKIKVALYLNDADKVIDTLVAVDNTLDADSINNAIMVINALDPDYRAADVLKALRVVNKKYTLKLYDDRDTWEPVLSKVRALIDTYSN